MLGGKEKEVLILRNRPEAFSKKQRCEMDSEKQGVTSPPSGPRAMPMVIEMQDLGHFGFYNA